MRGLLSYLALMEVLALLPIFTPGCGTDAVKNAEQKQEYMPSPEMTVGEASSEDFWTVDDEYFRSLINQVLDDHDYAGSPIPDWLQPFIEGLRACSGNQFDSVDQISMACWDTVSWAGHPDPPSRPWHD